MNFRKLTLLVAVIACSQPIASRAAVLGQTTGLFDNSETFFDSTVLTNDLVNIGQTTSLSNTTSKYIDDSSNAPAYGGYTLDGMHDGVPGGGANVAYWGATNSRPLWVTYELNTALNPLGYDITSIISTQGFGGNAAQYANQLWSVEYSLVGSPSVYQSLASVNYAPFAGGSGATRVTLTDTSGVLKSGVANLRFTIPKLSGSETGVYREMDVVGVATVPEPSSLVLAGAALCGMGLAGLRSRRAA